MTTSSLIRFHPVGLGSLSVAKASEPIGYNLYEVLLLMFTSLLTNGCRDSYSRMVGKQEVEIWQDNFRLARDPHLNRTISHVIGRLHGDIALSK